METIKTWQERCTQQSAQYMDNAAREAIDAEIADLRKALASQSAPIGYISRGLVEHALSKGFGATAYVQASAPTEEFPIAIYTASQPAQAPAVASPNPWESAIKDACTASCMDWQEDNPRASLQALIEWHVQIALDSRVSDRAPAVAVDALHMVYFDDRDKKLEIIVGTAAAEARFAQISGQWNAHLFVKIKSNSRDDPYYNANIQPAAPAGEPVAAILRDVTKLAYDDDDGFDEEDMMAVTRSDLRLILERHVAPVASAGQAQFQDRVQPWMMACFGAEISADRAERNHRFFEEAAELTQACGMTADEAHQLIDYVWGRPIGEPAQEVGGVMVTLAALCLAQGLNMHGCGETELTRIWTKVGQIRAKQAAKPKHGPLPMAQTTQPAGDELTDAAIKAIWGAASPTGSGPFWFARAVEKHVRAAIAAQQPAQANDARDAALLRKLVAGDVGRATLQKLADGQGTETEDGKAWLAAQAAIAAQKGE